ncbi:YkyA family protein [Virgibacillus sp. DJP39]|uniref:YkyA family protein n=1 Tax=Virgibacillus sp. DJP39 TaxID=3409790 RepID=UPI003BB763A1
MSYRKSAIILFVGLIAFLSGCNGSSPSKEIYSHLEKAVSLEESFEKQQKEIVELEKKEQELYSKIVDLSMDEFDKIKSISKEAIDVIEKRKNKIVIEKESIEAAKEEFLKVKELITELEDEKAKNKANAMYDIMVDRYDAYQELNKAYVSSLTLEKELYTLLQKEDLDQEVLTTHIKKINESYQKVLAANKVFNEHTEKYNQLKKEFYEAAEIDVEYEK